MVRMTRSTTIVGFGDSGTFLTSVQMEMEGTLLECEYRDLPARLSRKIKTFVSVDIEFTENPDWASHVDVYTDDGDRYIGTLQLRDRMHERQSLSERVGHAERKQDTRRKILIGGAVLENARTAQSIMDDGQENEP